MTIEQHPIFTGILLIVGAFLIGRLAFTSFVKGETVLWVMLLACGLFIGGFCVLKGWWRNNISDFNSQHNVNFPRQRYSGRF